MNEQKPVTPERIMQFAFGYAPTLILETALHYRLFDLIEAGQNTLDQLVKATDASPRGLRSILNALVGFEFLARADEHYSLTPESSAFLVSTKPGFRGALFSHMIDQLLPKWMQLKDVVRTGQPAMSVNAREEGAAFFAQFVEALFPLSYAAAEKLGQHLGISGAQQPISVLDLAAGSGVWGIALAKQSPRVSITAVDWPEVLEVTRRVAEKHGVAGQLKTAPGDLLAADFGRGHQVATLGHILHSEGEQRSRELLRKTFQALAPGGTIAIMEFVPNDERTGPPMPLLFSVNMLVNTEQGDTYTFAEISAWLKEAGFTDPRLLDVPAVSPLILANRPN